MMAKKSLPQQLLVDFVAMRLDEVDHQRILTHLADHEEDLLRVMALWESDLSAVPSPPIDLRRRILQKTIRAKFC